MTVGQALDQRRAAVRPRLVERLDRLAVDDVGVVAVDHNLRQAIGRRAVAGRARHRGDVADRRVFHVEVVLADEDHRQLPYHGEVQRLVERADVSGAIAEEADRDVFVASVLRAPGGAAGDRQMRADDGVGAHHAVLLGGEVHRAALAAHQTVVALHQLAEDLLHRNAARQCVRVSTVGAERKVPRPHRASETSGDRFLPERKMARSLHQVLKKKIIRALLGVADPHLRTVQFEPFRLPDIIVGTRGRGPNFRRSLRHLQPFPPVGFISARGRTCFRTARRRRAAFRRTPPSNQSMLSRPVGRSGFGCPASP